MSAGCMRDERGGVDAERAEAQRQFGSKVGELSSRKRSRTGVRWTQEMLAEESGLSDRTIRRLEQGETGPQRATAEALARVLCEPGAETEKFMALAAQAGGWSWQPDPDPDPKPQLQIVHVQVIETPLASFTMSLPATRVHQFMVSAVVCAETYHSLLYRYEVFLNHFRNLVPWDRAARVEATLWQDGREVFREEFTPSSKPRRHAITLEGYSGELVVERYPTENVRAMMRQRLTIEDTPIFDVDPAAG
jgi:DNA-binding XRE family transcriptional regulator